MGSAVSMGFLTILDLSESRQSNLIPAIPGGALLSNAA